MPWIPVKHALRKLREARGWTVLDLADKTRLSDKAIHNLESRTPPTFVRPDTADVISAAFDLKLKAYETWSAKDRWIVWVPHRKSDDVDADAPYVHHHGTLSRLARMERDLGLHDQVVRTAGGPLNLMGLDRLNKIFTTPKLHEGHIFAVLGKVDDHRTLNSSAAKKIGAKEDEGAIFRMTRNVAKRLPQYVSVFTTQAADTARLMSAYDDGERLIVRVRVVYDPPKGPWRGFFFIEADGQKTKKFALVVEAVVTETV